MENEKVEKSGNENKEINYQRIRKIISIILVISWMIIVFMFSMEVGTDSTGTSGETIRRILKLFKKDWDPIQLESMIEMFQPYARKIAHFTLYSIGGFLIYNLNKDNKKIKELESRNKYINGTTISIIFGMLYAITDEIHQAFVPGRDGRIMDVCIDSLEVFVGIEIRIILDKLLKK